MNIRQRRCPWCGAMNEAEPSRKTYCDYCQHRVEAACSACDCQTCFAAFGDRNALPSFAVPTRDATRNWTGLVAAATVVSLVSFLLGLGLFSWRGQ